MDIQQLEIARKKGPPLPHTTSSVRVPSLSIEAGTIDGSLDSNREDMKYLQSFAPEHSDRGYIRHEVNDPEPNIVLQESAKVTISVRLEQNQSSDVVSKINTQALGSQLDVYKPLGPDR